MKAIDRMSSAFLRKLILRMKFLELSQTALAKRMKVSRPYVAKVLSDDVNKSPDGGQVRALFLAGFPPRVEARGRVSIRAHARADMKELPVSMKRSVPSNLGVRYPAYPTGAELQ